MFPSGRAWERHSRQGDGICKLYKKNVDVADSFAWLCYGESDGWLIRLQSKTRTISWRTPGLSFILQTAGHHMARALELPGGVPPHYRFLGLLSEIPWNRAQKSFKKHLRWTWYKRLRATALDGPEELKQEKDMVTRAALLETLRWHL